VNFPGSGTGRTSFGGGANFKPRRLSTHPQSIPERFSSGLIQLGTLRPSQAASYFITATG
jgi:hypothetical protein